MRKWRTEDTKDLYNINGWGNGYLDINEKGNAVIYPKGKITGAGIDLKEVVDEVLQNEISLPLLLRFPDILDNRLERISACFDKASKEYNYNAQYFTVYPIKVNQQRPVVEEIVRHGKKFNIGLEAGSKPELHAVLAVMDNPKALLICNGYKDQEFIELALLAQKMGKRIYLVVEKLNELKMIYKVSQALDVKPNIGIRIKLSSSGSGKWELSGGDQSKFGLNASELMDAVEYAKEKDMLSCVQLIHFHLGSQITNIRKIKSGLREVAQFYVQLMKMGCPLEFVDIGGGLGVDYDGSSTSVESSLNYTIQEYANDAIYTLADACEKNNLKHPNLISESGRALTAHHSMLVFNVLESTSLPSWNDTKHALPQNCHEKILELHEMYHNLTSRNMLEAYHDAIQLREDILDMFSLGIITLADRATCERLFWSITRKCSDMAVEIKNAPEELTSLGKRLADKYFCNFSLFQSLPDSWAIDQLFPIIPIHRLNEKPEVLVTLQDITCDSDGKIEKFIGVKDYTNGLLLHPFKKGSDYFIGVFLVGAYQEILGDLHNLFGDTNVAHVVTDGNDGYTIERILHGESVADVLEYVQFDSRSLVRTMESWVNASVKAGKISSEEGKVFLANYSSGLYGYTYLEE
jgi:arginine decarboxylase